MPERMVNLYNVKEFHKSLSMPKNKANKGKHKTESLVLLTILHDILGTHTKVSDKDIC